jgi:hypothetical protein
MRTGSKAVAALAVIGFVAVSTLFMVGNKQNQQTSLFEGLSGIEGDIDFKFIDYVGKYQKSYGTKEEFMFRLKNFAKNYQKVMDHNSKSGKSYSLGINHMSDWTEEEFNMILGGKNQQA